MQVSGVGVVIFDTSALRALANGEARKHALQAIEASGRIPMISEVNLLEISPTVGGVGQRLRTIVSDLQAIAGGALPWTYELLRQAGEEFLQGKTAFSVSLMSLDISLDLPDYDLLREKAMAFTREQNEEASRVQREARPIIRNYLKARDAKELWPSFSDFLAGFWDQFDLKETFVEQAWQRLELPGECPDDLLAESKVFRIFNDINAVEVYQGAVAFQQPRQVQRMDLLQLPYLAAAPDTVLVTNDGPFAAVARDVVVGRYDGIQVIAPGELLTLSA